MNLPELFCRFLLLLVSILILYFFSNRKQPQTVNPLILIVGFCTFSLCFLFTKINVGVGIGFGLFAIFSILRFRTQAFSTVEILFLFVIITLSILDVLYPVENAAILLFFQITIIIAYIIGAVVVDAQAPKFKNTVTIKILLENEILATNGQLRSKIETIIGFAVFDFKVLKINTLVSEVDIEVHY